MSVNKTKENNPRAKREVIINKKNFLRRLETRVTHDQVMASLFVVHLIGLSMTGNLKPSQSEVKENQHHTVSLSTHI